MLDPSTISEAISVLSLAFIGGASYRIAHVLLERMGVGARTRPGPATPASLSVADMLDAELAHSVAAKAAHTLLYYDEICGDELNEFERYERSLLCEKRIHRAVVAYVDTVRRKHLDGQQAARHETTNL